MLNTSPIYAVPTTEPVSCASARKVEFLITIPANGFWIGCGTGVLLGDGVGVTVGEGVKVGVAVFVGEGVKVGVDEDDRVGVAVTAGIVEVEETSDSESATASDSSSLSKKDVPNDPVTHNINKTKIASGKNSFLSTKFPYLLGHFLIHSLSPLNLAKIILHRPI